MAADRGSKTLVIRSLLPYQIVLYLNGYYVFVFSLCELLMYIYKGETLPIPSGNLALEVIIVLLFSALEACRLFFGKKGNLTERVLPVIISLGLGIPSILCNVFLLLWQTYVLRAELILICIQLSFIGLETLLGVLAIIFFNQATPY